MWADRGELAGKPHTEGIPSGFFPGAAGHALPGCRTGQCVHILIISLAFLDAQHG